MFELKISEVLKWLVYILSYKNPLSNSLIVDWKHESNQTARGILVG
jgi:hypothetical protein